MYLFESGKYQPSDFFQDEEHNDEKWKKMSEISELLYQLMKKGGWPVFGTSFVKEKYSEHSKSYGTKYQIGGNLGCFDDANKVLAYFNNKMEENPSWDPYMYILTSDTDS